MTANWISLGCEQNKPIEDIILGFWETLIHIFSIFWHFIDQMTNQLFEKINNLSVDNENNGELQS